MIKTQLINIKRSIQENIDRSSYLRLDANERVIPFEKKLLKKVKERVNSFSVQSYPKNNTKILNTISNHENIDKKFISCFPGTDSSLKCIFEVLSRNKKEIMSLYPTYGMIDVYSRIYSLKIKKIPEKDILFFLKKNIKKNFAFLYLANPNQPSGNIIRYQELNKIIQLAKKHNKFIVIDEAYIDFSGQRSFSSAVKKFSNLIVLKNLSKNIGLAGLRFSYMVANPKISQIINCIRPPHDLSHYSIKVAEHFLKDKKILKNYIKQIKNSKKFVKTKCKDLKIDFKDTNANFFYIYLRKKNIPKIVQILKKKKILVKYLKNYKDFKNTLRITYGSKFQMLFFIKTLHKILRKT